MDMTKFENAEDPGFKAVAGELRRWVKELARPGDATVPHGEISPGDRTSEIAGGRTSDRQVLQITQGSPQYGPTTVSGGSVVQGNYVGRIGGGF